MPKWQASTSTPPGTIRRQTSPAASNERVFVAVQGTAGNTGATEPGWTLTRGGRTTDSGVTWQEITGSAVMNGDTANVMTWAQARAVTPTTTLGAIIKRNSGASFWMVASAGGTMGASEPAFVDTLGTSVTDSTVTWVCIALAASMPAPWSAPFARVAQMLTATWGVAGNDFYIADNHVETAVTFTVSLGTVTSPCRFISIDHTASLPANAAALKSGATFTATSTSTNAISAANVAQCETYLYGLNFVVTGAINGVGIIFGSAVASHGRMEKCTATLGAGTTSTTTMTAGSGSVGMMEFINCSFGFSVAGQFLYWSAGYHVWRDTPNPCFTGTVPNTPLHAFQNTPGTILFEGIDFSAVGSNTLLSTVAAGTFFTLKNCKMHTGPVAGAFATAQSVLQIDLINCDSGATIYRNERYNIYGTLLTSGAVYRNGGAVDGGTPVSHKPTTAAFCRPQRPFLCFPLSIWNDVIGSPVTVTVFWLNNSTITLPNNAQVWFDLEYMADSGSPITSFATCGLVTQLTVPTTWTADAVSVWTGASGTKCQWATSITVTPQQKGYFTLYPKIGAAVSNFYFVPKPVLS